MPDDLIPLIEIVKLITSAGGIIVFLGALITGQVYTKHAVDRLIAEKDARIEEKDERITILSSKFDEITSALKDSVDANKRLAEVEEMKIKLGITSVPAPPRN
jgi:D-serine deaminase-like pyridoxal phosphate-dependent protein